MNMKLSVRKPSILTLAFSGLTSVHLFISSFSRSFQLSHFIRAIAAVIRAIRTPFRCFQKDLSCVWCKSYDTHPCLSEETDHMIGNMSRTVIHQQDSVLDRAGNVAVWRMGSYSHGLINSFDSVKKCCKSYGIVF
jgi:hypothetical protein